MDGAAASVPVVGELEGKAEVLSLQEGDGRLEVVALLPGDAHLVALDRGAVHSGGLEEPISEVELELSGGGTASDLESLAKRLAERVSLTPANLSKAQRGYLLLARSST